ncbi:hypothetical protein EPUL_005777, partial [Erysiphe pulchra]
MLQLILLLSTAILIHGHADNFTPNTAVFNDISPDLDGKYTIQGIKIRASFVSYGASISNLFIFDNRGVERDIVAGWDNASYYTIDKQHPHFGGVPGRYANRIKNSSFIIDEERYSVLPNENPTISNPNGVNTLHGGPDGWDWRNWTVVRHTENSITFSLTDPDGKEGFPGEVISYVTYTLGNMTWDFRMSALSTTKKTPIMLTSHVGTYWNLDGFANNETNTALNHTLWLPFAGQRVGIDTILIPQGDILANAQGEANDFWSMPKQIGANLTSASILGNCGYNCSGYVARLQSPWSGIQLDLFTNQDAIQVYSCHGQNGSVALKKTQGRPENRFIQKYGCVVLETEDWIDGINHPEWGRKQVWGPEDGIYTVEASYRFSLNSTAVR